MLDAVQCLYVNNTDTPKFNEMFCDIRGASEQSRVRNFADDDHVITDQTMSAAHKLECGFGLAYSALAHDQDAFAVNVDQNTVDRNAGCKFHSEPSDDLSHKSACRARCDQSGNVVFSANEQHVFRRLCQCGENNTGYTAGDKSLKTDRALIFFLLHEVGILDIADDLDTLM